MIWIQSLSEGMLLGCMTVGKLALIILPLTILLEVAKRYGWIEFISIHAQGMTDILRLPRTAAVPVFIGVVFGIVSGSGIILQVAKEEKYTKEDLTVLFVLVGICHAIFEETIIFSGMGANLLIIVASRVCLGGGFAYMMAHILQSGRQVERYTS